MSESSSLSRGALARLIVLGVFAAVCAAGAILSAGATSVWQRQTNRYYEQSNGNIDENSPAYHAMQQLQLISTQVYNLIGPLTVAALVAAFVILSVLALRWARRHPLKP